MNIYKFVYNNTPITVPAVSYHNAIDKACTHLEDINESLELVGLDSWKEVQDVCEEQGVQLSDLEIYE